MRNHRPIKIAAGIRAVNHIMKRGMRVSMREPGKKTMYAPRMPEIAPLAPIDGTWEPQEKRS
jgi:hypothetical protein